MILKKRDIPRERNLWNLLDNVSCIFESNMFMSEKITLIMNGFLFYIEHKKPSDGKELKR